MGIFGYLKNVIRQQTAKKRYGILNNTTPVFSNFGNDIYLSDFVNNAIDRVASEISKINVKSIVEHGQSLSVQNDDITRLFRFKPNPLQTTQDFLSCVEWMRLKHRNVFIYPQYENVVGANGHIYKKYVALYPLKPREVYIGTNSDDVWEVRMDFEDGTSYTLPYKDLIHLRWRRGCNTTVGGGDDYGRAIDTDVLNTIVSLTHTIEGLPKSIEASLQIKGVYSAKTLADADNIKKIRDDFEEHIITSKSGMVAVDFAGEFTPIKIDAAEIPDSTMRFLKSVIQERYGISAAIMSGDYSGEQHDAFYQTVIEDFIIQFEQASTACLFTQREIDIGHRIKGYYSKVAYMGMSNKIALANFAKETGNQTLNQVNAMFGFEPFEGGDVRLRSLNFVDASIANEYQLGGKNEE